ncbi:nitroreductase family protein [uncultured Corynebacterium sp.]|uniref:nitroreductase family protein n=1 Tax=uncultured Corynebacterium sp. TaxID=159447 RepID=UPI00345C25EB
MTDSPGPTTPAERLARRYGRRAPFTPPAWNPVLDLLLRHRSVRQWLPGDIDDDTLHTIIAAAQSAPSSSNKQIVSVVAVRDPETRRRLAAVGGQMSRHVVDAPVTLVWLIDFSLARFLADREEERAVADGTPPPAGAGHGVTGRPATDLGALRYTDEPMAAAADIGIASQNTAVAAASLGLGTVFLGSLRNDIDEVRDALGIPETVVPFLGLELGHADPAENAGVKPRLPMELFLHEDRYSAPDGDPAATTGRLASYDAALASYYSRYGAHPRWSHQLLNRLSGDAAGRSGRRFLRGILQRAGFPLQ